MWGGLMKQEKSEKNLQKDKKRRPMSLSSAFLL
jgi:hypothetical protein